MQYRLKCILILVTCLFWAESCLDDSTFLPDIPVWVEEYPHVNQNVTTADLIVKLDTDSKVYWIVTDVEMNFTDREVIEKVEGVVGEGIVSIGVVDVNANKEVHVAINGLTQKTQYYVYFVAANADEVDALSEMKSSEFVTDELVILPPLWISNYPKITVDATTAQFIVKFDMASRVYWIITTSEMNMTDQEVIDKAKGELDDLVIANGIANASANEEMQANVTDLIQKTKYYIYFVAENIDDPAGRSDVRLSEFTTGEIEVKPNPPLWITDYPNVTHGTTTADFAVKFDLTSKVYWLVTNTNMSLSSQQVIAQAKGEVGGSIMFNGFVDVSANQEKQIKITGLTQKTKYYVYFAAANANDPTMVSVPKSSEFMTDEIVVNPNPPLWVTDYPKVTPGTTTADFTVKFDLTSKVYWIVTNTAASLTSQQVIAKAKGIDGGDVLFKGVQDATANQEKLIKATGLMQKTKYYVYFAAENASDPTGVSDVKSSEFTTREVVVTPNPPLWITDYPKLTFGTTTATVKVKFDSDSKIYWIVTNTAMSVTAQQVVVNAKAPVGGAVLFNGIADAISNQEKQINLTGLAQKTTYFVYIVGENTKDATALSQVKLSQFTTDEIVVTPGVPLWVAGFPKVAYGATSADLIFRLDINSKGYWIVTNAAMSLTAQQVIEMAKGIVGGGVLFKGLTDVTGNQEKLVTVAGLLQKTKYYVYFVAENVADATAQSEVKTSEFTTFERHATFTFPSTVESRAVQYMMYRPEEVLKYPNKKYPICFFMGGNGEVASQGQINLLRNGTLTEYISNGNNVPMMVMSIQHIFTNWNSAMVDEAVVHAFATYPVDTKKVYMSGISGGGFGCWAYAIAHPEKLTAIVPISGGGNTGNACKLKDISVWAFHNNVDGLVNKSNSENMINALNACPPNKEVKFTVFPDEGHDCWRRVYDQNHFDWTIPGKNGIPKVDIYTWLLSKSK